MDTIRSKEYNYGSRDEMRKRRELRKRKKRRKTIVVFLAMILVFITAYTIINSKNNERNSKTDVEVETVDKQVESGETKATAANNATPTPSPLATVTPTPTPTLTPTPTVDPASITTNFNQFDYYESDKQARYQEYQAKNPTMKPGDVVWRVNSNLDKPWYTADIPVDGYDPYIIVNKYYKVPDGYKPPDLVEVDGQKMRKNTADAYLKMQKDAASQGLKIRVVSAYRTVDYQRNLYNRYLSSDSRENVDRYSARPGYSEHHTGMAIDLFGSQDGLRNFVKTPEYTWVRDNGYKYGFIIRYQADIENITGYEDEPWHLRYIGVEVSTDMKNKGIKAYEEYYEKYIKKR